MPSQFVKTNNIQLHVMTDGPTTGASVILLHGFPEFHYGWRKQIPALAKAGLQVIVPDQRGYNLSDKPRGLSAYQVETLAQDILGLCDHYGIQLARLVGHDWGALVAWTLALQHPERVAKLAILNVPHPDVITRFILTNPEQRRRSWYVFFFQLGWFAEWALSRNDFHGLARTLVRSSYGNTFSPEDLAQYKKAWSQPGALTSMLNWYRAAFRQGVKYVLRNKQISARRVQPSTLILWGKNDFALSQAMVKPSLDLCEHGEAFLFDRATHWLQHDTPEKVNEKLIDFLKS